MNTLKIIDEAIVNAKHIMDVTKERETYIIASVLEANLKALRDKLGSDEFESKRLREVLIKCKESLETEATDTVWMKGGMFSPTMWEFITSELEVNENQGELFSEKAAAKAMGV